MKYIWSPQFLNKQCLWLIFLSGENNGGFVWGDWLIAGGALGAPRSMQAGSRWRGPKASFSTAAQQGADHQARPCPARRPSVFHETTPKNRGFHGKLSFFMVSSK